MLLLDVPWESISDWSPLDVSRGLSLTIGSLVLCVASSVRPIMQSCISMRGHDWVWNHTVYYLVSFCSDTFSDSDSNNLCKSSAHFLISFLKIFFIKILTLQDDTRQCFYLSCYCSTLTTLRCAAVLVAQVSRLLLLSLYLFTCKAIVKSTCFTERWGSCDVYPTEWRTNNNKYHQMNGIQ